MNTAKSGVSITPVGRIVQGSCFDFSDTDMDGNPLTDGQGKPRVEYFIALAIPKTDPAFNELWQKIHGAAIAQWPHLFGQNGQQLDPKRPSLKVRDGDAPEHAKKEGFPGHWVVALKNGFPPKCHSQATGSWIDLTTPESIQCGYWVRAAITIKANNKSDMQSGVYINLWGVELVSYAEIIQPQGGVDTAAAFGAVAAAAIPPGTSTTPVAPAGGMPGVPAAAPPPVAPAAVPAPGGYPQVGAAPPPPAAPAAAPAPVAAPAPPVTPNHAFADGPKPQMYRDNAGNGPFTEAQLTPLGYTPEMLIPLRWDDIPF